MADDGKKAKRSAAKDDSGVLAGLSATRPSRLSRRSSAGGADGGAQAAPAKATARAAPGPARAKPSAPKAAKPPAPKAAKPPAAPAETRPRAVRAATPTLKEPIAEAAARREDRPLEDRRGPQGPAELATTVVQAAGELAQIGLTVGGQILKRAAEKLPKP